MKRLSMKDLDSRIQAMEEAVSSPLQNGEVRWRHLSDDTKSNINLLYTHFEGLQKRVGKLEVEKAKESKFDPLSAFIWGAASLAVIILLMDLIADYFGT